MNSSTNKPAEDDACSVTHRHERAVRKAICSMPNPESIRQTAGLFKALGDETRMRILCALKETELCVCDLCAVLEMNQSAISHQLRFLKQSRLVRSRRDGRIIYYSLDDDHVGRILEVGISHAGVH